MFWLIICSLLTYETLVWGYNDFEELEDMADDYVDYYENYYYGRYHTEARKEEKTSAAINKEEEFINRVKRYREPSPKTLSPDEVREVKGALNDLLSGMGVERPFTPYSTETNDAPSFEAPLSSTPTYIVSETTLPTTELSSTTTYDPYFTDVISESTIIEIKKIGPTRTPKQQTIKGYMDELRNKFASLNPLLDLRRRNKNDVKNITEILNITTVPTTTTTKQLDIPRLLEIIADLASEFETNLTRKLNETLIQMSIPTCTTPTMEPPVTSEYDSNYTGATIAKCFVCGLDMHGIPSNAHCADAFAGDFLPLVPVDPTAKGKISKFRKYCKYSNEPGYRLNETQPRSIYGRWTGGCSVRWIDLSGTYTQRSYRNRMFPAVGKHYASKRMAKLERTLWNVEDGCVTSPMATLIPLSRGVSLYARFHACVCTGNWCNTASHNTQWMWNFIILLLACGIT